ncbi:MAG: crossover junction endodeoxyribonuclease RuvC [Candidatus Helarchaeota archaeon]
MVGRNLSEDLVMGIDPDSKKCGVVILDPYNERKVVYATTYKTQFEDEVERLNDIATSIEVLLLKYHPEYIVCEMYHNTLPFRFVKIIFKLLGMIEKTVYEFGSKMIYITGTRAKKKIGLRGNASKEEVKRRMEEILKFNFETLDESDAALVAYAFTLELNGDQA